MVKCWRKPLDSECFKAPVGHICLIADRCKGCGFCVEFCPRKVLELSEEYNSKGYHPPLVKDGDACVFCGLCEAICPEFAIYVVKEEEAANTEKEKAGSDEE